MATTMFASRFIELKNITKPIQNKNGLVHNKTHIFYGVASYANKKLPLDSFWIKDLVGFESPAYRPYPQLP